MDKTLDHTKFNENKITDKIVIKISLWYEDPTVLLENISQFLPTNDLSTTQKINALARMSILIALIIIVSKSDSKWLSVPVVIIILTLFLGYTEPFNDNNILTDDKNNKTCQRPTENNPYMNYTLADLVDNPERAAACKYQDVKQAIKTKFASRIHADEYDIFGKNISDRMFYIMPNTRMINDQSGFAKWCYNIYDDGGTCKENGENCLAAIDPRYQKGRFINVD
jgi:hypothetical protein